MFTGATSFSRFLPTGVVQWHEKGNGTESRTVDDEYLIFKNVKSSFNYIYNILNCIYMLFRSCLVWNRLCDLQFGFVSLYVYLVFAASWLHLIYKKQTYTFVLNTALRLRNLTIRLRGNCFIISSVTRSKPGSLLFEELRTIKGSRRVMVVVSVNKSDLDHRITRRNVKCLVSLMSFIVARNSHLILEEVKVLRDSLRNIRKESSNRL